MVDVPVSTTARVSPTRARATNTGTLSLPKPRVLRLPVSRADPRALIPLKLRRKYVSSASTIPPRGGCSVGAENAMTLCRQRHAVLWLSSTSMPVRRVDNPSRIVSANAGHFSGMCVPAIAVRVRSLNVRAQARHR